MSPPDDSSTGVARSNAARLAARTRSSLAAAVRQHTSVHHRNTTLRSPTASPPRDHQAPGKLMWLDSRLLLLPLHLCPSQFLASLPTQCCTSPADHVHAQQATRMQRSFFHGSPTPSPPPPPPLQVKTSCWGLLLQAGAGVQSCSSCAQKLYWFPCNAASCTSQPNHAFLPCTSTPASRQADS